MAVRSPARAGSLLAGLAALFVFSANDSAFGLDSCPSTFRKREVELTCRCSAEQMKRGKAYGTLLYTDDSTLCIAARHAGAIGEVGGPITVRRSPGLSAYEASTRNGITSRAYGRWSGSLRFVSVDPAILAADARPSQSQPAVVGCLPTKPQVSEVAASIKHEIYERPSGAKDTVIPEDIRGTWRGSYKCDGKSEQITFDFNKNPRLIMSIDGSVQQGYVDINAMKYSFELKAKVGPRMHRLESVNYLATVDSKGEMWGRLSSCSGNFRAWRSNTPAPPPNAHAHVPVAIGSIEGAWDGAVMRDDGNAAGPIRGKINLVTLEPFALDIKASGPGTYAAKARYQETEYEFELRGSHKFQALPGLAMFAKQGWPNPTFPVGSLGFFPTGDAAAWEATGSLWNFTRAVPYRVVLRRRKPGAPSLETQCKGPIARWFKAYVRAFNDARDLKVEFFPALDGWDTNGPAILQASFTEGPIDMARLFDCFLTGQVKRDGKTIVGAEPLIDQALLDAAVVRLYEAHENAIRPLDYPQAQAVPEVELRRKLALANDRLATIVRDTNQLVTLSEILAYTRHHASEFSELPIAQLRERLQPLRAALDEAYTASGAARSAERSRQVAEVMAGTSVPWPLVPPGRVDLVRRVVEGRAETLSISDRQFITGMLQEAARRCQQPAASIRLRLTGLLIDGALVSFNIPWDASPAVGGSRIVTNTVEALEGAAFVKMLQCPSDFLEKFFTLVADSQSPDATLVRAPLMVRTCALDRSVSQCTCLVEEAEKVSPGIGKNRFTRDVIAPQRHVAMVAKMIARCGLTTY
ncbi:LCCL domain-containing protein [Methylobacterium organophilum]|nr:LCCL domain-containing protein [Methylobacterium organophilum]